MCMCPWCRTTSIHRDHFVRNLQYHCFAAFDLDWVRLVAVRTSIYQHSSCFVLTMHLLAMSFHVSFAVELPISSASMRLVTNNSIQGFRCAPCFTLITRCTAVILRPGRTKRCSILMWQTYMILSFRNATSSATLLWHVSICCW